MVICIRIDEIDSVNCIRTAEAKPIKDRNNKISHENDFAGGRGGGSDRQQREAAAKVRARASDNCDEGMGGEISEGSNNNNGRIITPNLKMFTFGELRSATRNFRPDTVVGEGGFGRVFKGWVDEKTYAPSRVGVGIPVAVKKSNPDSEQGLKEWQVIPSLIQLFSNHHNFFFNFSLYFHLLYVHIVFIC